MNPEDKSFLVGFRVCGDIFKVSDIKFNRDTSEIIKYSIIRFNIPSEFLSEVIPWDTTLQNENTLIEYTNKAGGFGPLYYNPYDKNYYRVISLSTNNRLPNWYENNLSVIVFRENSKFLEQPFYNQKIFPVILGFGKKGYLYFETQETNKNGDKIFAIKRYVVK